MCTVESGSKCWTFPNRWPVLNGVLHWRLQSRVLRGCAWSLGRSPPAFLGPGSPLVKQLRTQNDVKALSTLTIPPMEETTRNLSGPDMLCSPL
ncbi:Adenylate cyclase type 9 [Manis javanica]|nr:Adenylate cyclase type 9 [Manis javanica]